MCLDESILYRDAITWRTWMNFYVIIASKKFEVVVWNIDQSEVTFESVETKSVLRQLTFPANV
jgi:hypothetical protein